jgi:3-hydroxybutyryl-CoA dehydrogenase
MGGGIAHAFLLAGSSVVVVDQTEALEAAEAGIRRAIATSVERGTTELSRAKLDAAFRVSADRGDLADRDLVVEAIPEIPDLKTAALREVEALLGDEAVLATNTSSLLIDGLAASLTRPERFLGLHFFNPVPVSTLVEVVAGAATDPGLVGTAGEWVRALGKTPVTVRDAPGFASSRLGVALALEAIRMLEQGVASAEDIDAAMVLGYKHATGPLRTTDVVGLDVRLGIAEYLHAQLGERFEPPALLREMVAAGKLGRKTGEGFFVWDQPGRDQP